MSSALKQSNAIQAVILDLAGTTLDFGCMAPAEAFREVFAQFGVPIFMEEARRPMGAAKKRHIKLITDIPDVRERWRERHGRLPTDEDVEAMFNLFVPVQMEILKKYSDLIPETTEAISFMRNLGMKIGSTTGYTRGMMEYLLQEAKRQGYEPDASVCPDDVPTGRPEPFMCLENMRRLELSEPHRAVKVDDTVPGIQEGLNAGMWTIGITYTGSEVGLPEKELYSLKPAERRALVGRVRERLMAAGADFVIPHIGWLPGPLQAIADRIVRGELPAPTRQK